jgi:hypothetical protein
VLSGVNYVSTINTLLASVGFSASYYSISANAATLPNDMAWEIGANYLDIINTLLKAINYRQLHFDGNGIGIGQAYILPESRGTDYTITPDTDSFSSPEMKVVTNFNESFNVVILTRTSTKATDTLRSVKKNFNTSHPGSIPRLGDREVTYGPENVEASDQTALDNLASRKLTEVSQVFQELTLDVASLPFLDDQDKILYTDPDVNIDTDGNGYILQTFVIDLADPKKDETLTLKYTIPVAA